MTSTEEDFNNHVSRMTFPVDTSWPLSPDTPVIRKGLVNKEALREGAEVVPGLSSMVSSH